MLLRLINVGLWVFLIGLSSCGNPNSINHHKTKRPHEELMAAQQKTKEQEKKLLEAKLSLEMAKTKSQPEIDDAVKKLALSLENLRKSKIPLIQKEITLLENHAGRAKMAFDLTKQQSKSNVLNQYFIHQIKPSDETLNKLDDDELSKILNDLHNIFLTALVK